MVELNTTSFSVPCESIRPTILTLPTGANAIIQWTHDNHGFWRFAGGFLNTISDHNFLLGGSNGGANMRFSVGIHPSDRQWDTVTLREPATFVISCGRPGTVTSKARTGSGGWRLMEESGAASPVLSALTLGSTGLRTAPPASCREAAGLAMDKNLIRAAASGS